MVSVVDAFNFYRNLKSVEQLKDRQGEGANKDDERNIVTLLMEQVFPFSSYLFSSPRFYSPLWILVSKWIK